MILCLKKWRKCDNGKQIDASVDQSPFDIDPFFRFYVEDEVLNVNVPWERPPIASVYAVYGTNLPVSASVFHIPLISNRIVCRQNTRINILHLLRH